MPDDERTRRRLGDETKERIASLASGWTTEPEPPKPLPRPAGLSDRDVDNIHAYLIDQSWVAYRAQQAGSHP